MELVLDTVPIIILKSSSCRSDGRRVRAPRLHGGPVRAARPPPLAPRSPLALARTLRILPAPHRLARYHWRRAPGTKKEKKFRLMRQCTYILTY